MKTIYLIAFLLLSAVGFSQDNCKELLQGKYAQQNNPADGYIEFKDNYLYEVNGDEYIKSKIEWQSSCSYKLILLETNIKGVVIPKGAELAVTILDAQKDAFTVTFDFIPTEKAEPVRMVRYKE